MSSHSRSLLAAVGTALLACATAQAPQAPTALELDEAAEALQGTTGTIFFERRDLVLAAEALRAVRRVFPVVRGIAPYRQNPLQLMVTDSAWRIVSVRQPRSRDSLVLRTGLRGVDSLNATLGARAVRADEYAPVLWVTFPVPVNVPAIAAVYQRLPEVRGAGPTTYLGGGGSMTIRIRQDRATVDLTLTRGWGDCPSGCIHRRTYVFVYNRRTGRVRKVRESGDPVPGGPLSLRETRGGARRARASVHGRSAVATFPQSLAS
ncbi:MAG TPA: hypothetical protein VFS20_11805 [Longimicrobium sp.]|nr:hypothetical protein [Longimicrobium sp.]